MAGVINTSSIANDLKPLVTSWFGFAHKDFGKQHEKIFELVKSGDAFERFALFSGLGLSKVVAEGAAVEYDTMSQKYIKDYSHVKYGLGFQITMEAIQDGKSLKLAKIGAERLKKAVGQTREIVGANILNRAFDNNFVGGDLKELCARDHPTTSGTDLANEPAVAADLSEASLEQAVIDVDEFRDDRGLKMVVNTKRLIIPSEERFNAHRILKSPLRVGVADNDANALNDMGLHQDVSVNNYLTDSDAWFLMTDADDGLVMYDRMAPEISTDNAFDTKNAKFMVITRFIPGWGDPRGIYGSPGAA